MDIDFSILNNIFSKVSDIKNNLTSTDTNKPLSAKQGQVLKTQVDSKVNISDIQDTLLSQSTNKPLSANQGSEILLNYYLLEKMPVTVTYEDETTEEINLLTNILDSPNLLKVVVLFDEDFKDIYEEYYDSSLTSIDCLIKKNNEYDNVVQIQSQNNWVKIIDLTDYETSYQNYTWDIDISGEYTYELDYNQVRYQKENLIIYYLSNLREFDDTPVI